MTPYRASYMVSVAVPGLPVKLGLHRQAQRTRVQCLVTGHSAHPSACHATNVSCSLLGHIKQFAMLQQKGRSVRCSSDVPGWGCDTYVAVRYGQTRGRCTQSSGSSRLTQWRVTGADHSPPRAIYGGLIDGRRRSVLGTSGITLPLRGHVYKRHKQPKTINSCNVRWFDEADQLLLQHLE